MEQHVKTKILADGLRYESKAGAPTGLPGAIGATMSCFQCGKHVPRSTLRPFLLAGSRHYRCRDGC